MWGGHIFDRGKIVPRKRPCGRPRKNSAKPTTEGCSPDSESAMTKNVASTTPERIRAAADQLYNAECALHTAHQSGVAEWIHAANNKLHDAVSEYIAAVRAW